MLMIDTFLTLITWLPYHMYISIAGGIKPSIDNTTNLKEVYTIKLFLTTVSLTNCFSTPIVYFIFNGNFRVSMSCCLFKQKKQ